MNSPVELLELVVILGDKAGGPCAEMAVKVWEAAVYGDDPLDFHPNDHFSPAGQDAALRLTLVRRCPRTGDILFLSEDPYDYYVD